MKAETKRQLKQWSWTVLFFIALIVMDYIYVNHFYLK